MKKRVSIITTHSIYNYGSALQSYATQHFLESNGYEASIIDYRPCYDKTIIRKIKDIVIKVLFAPKYIIRYRRYKDFHENRMKLTKRYNTYEELCSDIPEADIYISGSDQIWNTAFPCGYDKSYTLGFTNSDNKLAYSSSMGRSNMPKSDLENLAKRIKSYKWIAMREKSGVDQLKTVGVDSVNVLDPVFLLKDYYKSISIKPNIKEKYILVYAVHTSEELNEVVQEMKDRLNIKVVLVGDFPIRCKHDISAKEAGPLEFVGLIENAEFIITNSFHCVSFCIMLEKQFMPVMPRVNTSRLTNILNISGLQKIAISTVKELKEQVDFIDYSKVTPKINLHADNSAQQLLDELQKL